MTTGKHDNPFMRPRKALPRYRFRDDVAWREVEGVYHVLTADNQYHCVQDEVGSLVLRQVEARASVDQIVAAVEARFDTSGANVRRDIQMFLSELVRKRVLARGQSDPE